MGTISADPGDPTTGPSIRGPAIGADDVLSWLQTADLDLEGRIAWSSNATFLCRLLSPGAAGDEDREPLLRAVYKPRQGERPLWDFTEGTLCLRERAAWLVDQALGWELVPPTVLREGPFGFGALQAFIPHDPQLHYLAAKGWDRRALRRLVAFDALINNADRKSGHILADEEGRLWAIDHGICFHEEPKLRTVIWDWAGERLPAAVRADLRVLSARLIEVTDDLVMELATLLSPAELAALAARCAALVKAGCYPEPDPDRHHVPWPPV
ncbi:MAG: SCO1664 family protein [Anaerolineae bacterium]|nr:SCO1664 family protein [Ardenticatenia bacterium]HRA19769.1 SCO1664 family protein [Anaerolineae bacterium]